MIRIYMSIERLIRKGSALYPYFCILPNLNKKMRYKTAHKDLGKGYSVLNVLEDVKKNGNINLTPVGGPKC